MTIELAETTTALMDELRGPDGSVLDDTLASLPVALASALGLHLAGVGDPAARDLANHIFETMRPLTGDIVRIDDNAARLALALDRPADALELLRERLLRSEALSAYQMLAAAYLALGKHDEATALAARLISETGERVTAWLIQGEVALATSGPQAGAEAYSQALRLAPSSVGALLGWARCLAALDDDEAARELVARVYAAYQDAPSGWILDEALDVARRLGDDAWADDIRARQAHLTAAEASRLRAQVAEALAQAREGTAIPSRRRRDQTLGTARRISAPHATRDPDADDLEADDADDADESTADTTAEPDEEQATPELVEALRDAFGYETFLPGQTTIIQAVLRGEDVLAVMPTGAGKSLCYQLPALLSAGTTLLISPLIALMKDQVEGLPAAVRRQTTVINSLVDRDEVERRLRGIAEGRYKLVYAAPERLRQQSFLYALRRAGIARFVIDEAHCVSLWGHDFRPDYLFIAKALRYLSEGGAPVQVLALTATATPEVRQGIAEALGRELLVVNRGVFRPNLSYEVIPVGNNDDRMRALAEIVRETPGCGIVYVRSRDGCEQVAEFLRRRCHVAAQHYHAGMAREEREAAQDAFISGRTPIVVATVAFGMGIDKPDVRFIVHYQLPGSLEAYVQESGRAGRDGRPSRCVLFASFADVSLLRRHLRQDELSIETLRAVYAAARNLARAGAPAGSAIGRVAAGDLERVVGAAVAAGAEGGRPIDETGARVALSILERAGFLRRHPDVPRAPGVMLVGERADGDAQSAAFHTLAAEAGLRPGQLQTVDLLALAARLGQSPAELEERFLAWRDAGLLDYREGPRDLALEICPPPADGKTALPALLADLAERHERQVTSLANYTRTGHCRQRVIARHFGERLRKSGCATCDRCRGTAAASVPARRPSSPSVHSSRTVNPADLRETILACLRELPYAVGVTGLVRILHGSADTGVGAARSPQFGTLASVSKARLTREIQAMVAEGLLERDEAAQYPVLHVRQDH